MVSEWGIFICRLLITNDNIPILFFFSIYIYEFVVIEFIHKSMGIG